MEIKGGGQPLILPPPQSPLPGQSCCVCSPLCHSKSFTQWGTRERFTTELSILLGKKSTLILPLPLHHYTCFYFQLQMIRLTFARPLGGPRGLGQGVRDGGDPNQWSWDHRLCVHCCPQRERKKRQKPKLPHPSPWPAQSCVCVRMHVAPAWAKPPSVLLTLGPPLKSQTRKVFPG